jgi:hypothetical protein
MAENSISNDKETKPVKETETDQMSEVLWWFSTAIKDLVQDCTVDRNRYKILGSAMLFTWLYATLAWGYFWSTNSDSPFLFVSLGLFMGGFVLSIDRVLVSSINKKRTNIVAIVLRVVMALCIGAFLAQPIILFIFSSDIDREVPILLDKKLAEKKIEVEQVYQSRKEELLANKKLIDDDLKKKSEQAVEKQNEYLKEIDGTGGSGKFGIAGIAKAKQNGYLIAKDELGRAEKNSAEELEKIKKELDEINTKVTKSVADFEKTLDGKGFLIKKEALQSLFDKDKTHGLQNQYYLLMIILTLFELIPIISKLFMTYGAYDTKVALREEYEINVATMSSKKELEEKERELTS